AARNRTRSTPGSPVAASEGGRRYQRRCILPARYAGVRVGGERLLAPRGRSPRAGSVGGGVRERRLDGCALGRRRAGRCALEARLCRPARDPFDRTLWRGALRRALESGVAACDTLFVELADRESLPLATFDELLPASF